MSAIIKILGFVSLHSRIFHCVKFLNSRANRVPVLMYHGVRSGDGGTAASGCLDLLGMTVSTACLEDHLRFITSHFTVISLGTYIGYRQKKNGLPKNPLIITFDDGFRNNYIFAGRLLEKYGAVATFFIIGNTLTNGDIQLHRLYYAIDKCRHPLQKAKLDAVIQGAHASKDGARKDIVFLIRDEIRSGKANLTGMLKKIEEISGALDDYDPAQYKSMYMSAQELTEMATKGFEIGAHSMSHQRLASLGSGEKKYEIFGSFKTVRELVHDSPIHFAYPFGQKNDFDEETKHLVASAGFSSGLSTVYGLNTDRTDLFELRRIDVRNFSKYELAMRVSGLFGLIKNMIKSVYQPRAAAHNTPE